MSRLRLSLLLLSAALVLGGLGLGASRIAQLERNELEHQSEPATLAEAERREGSTRVSARLTTLQLREGEHAVFEICAEDTLEAERWADTLTLAVWRLPAHELMLKVPLDEAHLARTKRSARRACLTLGSGNIDTAGTYAVDAVWPDAAPPAALKQVPLHVRVLARTPLKAADHAAVWAVLVGGILGIAAFWLPREPRVPGSTHAPTPELETAPTRVHEALKRSKRRHAAILAAGLGAVALGTWSISRAPLWGSTMGLLKGGLLAGVETLVALALAWLLRPAGPTHRVLGLHAPRRPVWTLPIAVLAGVVLVAVARVAVRWVPSTGTPPIQTFVSWPSGMLSFATLGALVPLAEELFFRGLVYRAALAWGRAAAFLLAWLPFVAVHAEQTWGGWGGLTAVAITGAVLTALRAYSGSVLAPALAHLLYNAALALRSL